MRFRFCGDLDCPDWILSEINTLARLSSVKMKLVCVQVSKSLLGGQLDFGKIKTLTADAKFEPGDVKACVAALSFILTSSAKHGVSEDALASELQQLGLPKEHTTALCRVHSESISPLSVRLRQDSLRLSRLAGVKWRLDIVAGSSRQSRLDEVLPHAEVHLGLKVNNPAEETSEVHHLCLSPTQLRMLTSEIKRAAAKMELM